MRVFKILIMPFLAVLLLSENGWGQSCDNSCQIDLGSSDSFVSFSGDITNDNGNETASHTIDVHDGTTTGCPSTADGTDDYEFNFITEEYFDVYGGNTIASGTGSVTRDITQSGSGLRGNNRTDNGTAATTTSTGDASCYSIEVIYNTPQEAQYVDVEMTSINLSLIHI